MLGLRNTTGTLRVAICRSETFLEPSCARTGVAPAGAGTVRIADVPPGQYAVQAFHDENGNGRLDRGFVGRPLEGMGFSRDAPMRFGPPRFPDAAIEVPPRGGALALTIRYFQ